MPAGFLLAEDAAVKERFSHITVTDDRKNDRPVKVFFRYPEGETEKEYPFITIENIGLQHARNLQHSEVTYYYSPNDETSASALTYFPSEQSFEDLGAGGLSEGMTYTTDSFVPVYLMYQVSTYARSALHDRQITAKMLRYFVPFRRGSILVPEDGTARRFDLLGWSNSDLLDQESGYRKRIFRKVYTVQMTAEIPVRDLEQVQQVTSVVGIIQPENNEILTPFQTLSSEDF
jgi:hypothetical protein